MPRRYGFAPQLATAPGLQAGSEIRQGGAEVVAPEDCTPAWNLVWLDMADSGTGETGTTLSEDRKTATATVDGNPYPEGPWGWMAQLEGETCCCEPEWTVTWDGEVYAPEYIKGRYAVAVMAGIRSGSTTLSYVSEGTLTVTVTCGGESQEITLEITQSGGYY